MTLNVLWSDANFSYVLTDSARTHSPEPRHAQSVLGQSQRLDRLQLSVEEGAQKIIPFGTHYVAALCGAESDALEFVRRVIEVQKTGDVHPILEYAAGNTESVRLEVAIGGDEGDEPFHVYLLPSRVLRVVGRKEIYVSGSLGDTLTLFLSTAIGKGLIERTFSENPEVNLVAALTYATTMAINNDLPAEKVGGAIFGGWIDRDGFHWQPDIVYLVYGPDFGDGLPEVPSHDTPIDPAAVPMATSRFMQIQCFVRDNVSVAISVNNGRAVAAASQLSTPSPEEWTKKWIDMVRPGDFTSTRYFVFVPKVRGRCVIVPNDGKYVRFDRETFAFSTNLAANLRAAPPEGEDFALVLMT